VVITYYNTRIWPGGSDTTATPLCCADRPTAHVRPGCSSSLRLPGASDPWATALMSRAPPA